MRRVCAGGDDRDHEHRCSSRGGPLCGLLRTNPRNFADGAGNTAKEHLIMDVLAVVLGLVMFAVLYVLIFGIERI